MTKSEILNYFSNENVYIWNGTSSDLKEYHNLLNIGYNTLIVDGCIYFVSHGVIDYNDDRVHKITT